MLNVKFKNKGSIQRSIPIHTKDFGILLTKGLDGMIFPYDINFLSGYRNFNKNKKNAVKLS